MPKLYKNLAWLVLLALSLPIIAEEPAPAKEIPKVSVAHLPGDFLFRILVGYGTGQGKVAYTGGDVTTIENGLTAFYNMQLGMAVKENLVLFGEIGTTGTKMADIVNNGVADSLNKLERFNIAGFGIGAMYFLMPSNFYLTTQLRFPQLVYGLDLPGNSGFYNYTSKFGIGIGMSAGIEFAVSGSLATGVALVFLYDFPTPRYADIQGIENYFIGLSATLTYN